MLGWEPFGSAHRLVRCKLDVGVNARVRADVSLRDVTIIRDETGDGVRMTSRTRSAQRFVKNLKKVKRVEN